MDLFQIRKKNIKNYVKHEYIYGDFRKKQNVNIKIPFTRIHIDIELYWNNIFHNEKR